MGLRGAPATPLVPTDAPSVLPATVLAPAMHCATVGEQQLGRPAEGVGASRLVAPG